MKKSVTINGTNILFTDESKALGGVIAVTSRKIADVFGKQHSKVMGDLKEASDKIGVLNFGDPQDEPLFVDIELRDKANNLQPAMAVSEKLFYQVVLAYRTDTAFAIRKQFIDSFFEMKEAIRCHEIEKLEMQKKQIEEHSNRSKGQNNREKKKLRARAKESEVLVAKCVAFLNSK